MKFLLDVFNAEHSPRIIGIIKASKIVVSSYLLGLLLEMIAVTALNVLGFWMIGCRYIFLLALMAAVLNLIPYIGMIIAGIISVFITMSYTQEISVSIGILVVLIVVQTIDNNFIFPKIVGGKVKVNAFFSIVAVFSAEL